MITKYENNPGLYDSLFDEINILLHKLAEGKDLQNEDYDDTTNPFYRYTNKGVKEAVPIETAKKNAQDILTRLNGDEEPTSWTDVKIDTIEKYFGVIGSLNDYINTKYSILPLDEPYFEIDTDLRQIKPPSTNTVYAVKGDDCAETLYFVVDRYFDNIDLASQKIVIEWDNGFNKGMTEETVRDLISRPEEIIFGWTITDDATSQGNYLKFAVRFYDYDVSRGVLYSLSTTPFTIPIKEGLAHDFTKYSIIKPSDRIFNLLQDNDINGIVKIGEPEYQINLTTDLENGTNLPQTLQVLAYSKDSGDISYKWYKGNSLSEGNNVIIDSSPIAGTEAVSLKEQKPEDIKEDLIPYGVYFTELLGGKVLDTKEEIDDIFNDGDNNSKVYLRISEYTPSVPGYYYCLATNTAGKSSKSAASNFIWVPSPAKPQVDIGHSDNILIYVLANETTSLQANNLTIKYKFNDTIAKNEKTSTSVTNIITKQVSMLSSEYEEVSTITYNSSSSEPQKFTIFTSHQLNGAIQNSDNYIDINVYNPIDTPAITIAQDPSTQEIVLTITNPNAEKKYLNPTNSTTLLEQKIILNKYDEVTGAYTPDSSFGTNTRAKLGYGSYTVQVQYDIKDTVSQINTNEIKQSNVIEFSINGSGNLA